MARRIRKIEAVVEDTGSLPGSNGNGKSPSNGELKPILGTVARTNLGPDSTYKLSEPSYTAGEVEAGKGEGAQEKEMQALGEILGGYTRRHRTEVDRQRARRIRHTIYGIGAVAALVAGLSTWTWKTIDLAIQNNRKDAIIAERDVTIANYKELEENVAIVREQVLPRLEEGFRTLEEKLGAPGSLIDFIETIGGAGYAIDLDIRGRDNQKIMSDLLAKAANLSNIDLKEISNAYQLKTYGIDNLIPKYPGVELLRIGKTNQDIVGQQKGPTENLLRIGISRVPHEADDTNSLNSKETDVYVPFRAKVVADYMDRTKGRTIGFQALDIADELGRPIAIFASHFANYNAKFPKYKLYTTVFDEGDLVGSLGLTGVATGLHLHQESKVGTEIDPRTGEVPFNKWAPLEIHLNKLRYINSVIWTLDNIPKDFQTNIIKFWQNKN